MTKKTLKRVSKKKQLTKKKSVRKHLTKNLTQQEQATSPNMQALRQTLTPTSSGKSLRSSLMMGMSMNPMFGMNAQQYGNITNERKINEQQNKSQTLTEQINNDKRTIDELTTKNQQLEKEAKEYKKQKKEQQHEVEQMRTKRDIAKDDLNESKREELEMQKLMNEFKNLRIQNEEYDRKNEIVKYKGLIDTEQAKLHGLKMQNQQLEKAYEQNYYYQELEKVKADVQIYETKNKALTDAMGTDDFKNPNKELEAQYKALELKKRENEILQQREKNRKN